MIGEAPHDAEVVLDDEQRQALVAQRRAGARRSARPRWRRRRRSARRRAARARRSRRRRRASAPAGRRPAARPPARRAGARSGRGSSRPRRRTLRPRRACCGVAKQRTDEARRGVRRPAEATSRCSSGVSDGKTAVACSVRDRRRRRRRSRPASGAIVPASMRSTVVLPGAVRADERGHGPRLGADGDVVGCDERAVALDEAARLEAAPGRRARVRCRRRSAAARAGLIRPSQPSETTPSSMIAASSVVRPRVRETFSSEPIASAATERMPSTSTPATAPSGASGAADQHDDEELEREVRPVARRVADAGELHGERAGEPGDGARRRDARSCASGETARRARPPRARARGRRRGRARAASVRARRSRARRARSGRARARSARPVDGPPETTVPCVPPSNQSIDWSAKATSHDDDPGRRGEARARQPDERAAHERAGGAARGGAREGGDDRRRAELEQVRRDDRAGRHERALRERRQARRRRRRTRARSRRTRGRGRLPGRRAAHRRRRAARTPRRANAAVASVARSVQCAPRVAQPRRRTREARSLDRLGVAPGAPGEQREPERERDHVAVAAEPPPQCAEVTVAWIRPSAIPASERLARLEPGDDRGDEPVEPVARGSVDVERGRRRGEDGGEARPRRPPARTRGRRGSDTGRPTITAASKSCAIASSARPNRVRCSSRTPSAASASAARRDEERALPGSSRRRGARRRRRRAPERQRIREDVRRPVEEDDEQRPDREGDGERRADPADHRAARAVRLDREEVRARARGGRDDQADDEREQEPAAADARLRDRPGAGRDEAASRRRRARSARRTRSARRR